MFAGSRRHARQGRWPSTPITATSSQCSTTAKAQGQRRDASGRPADKVQGGQPADAVARMSPADTSMPMHAGRPAPRSRSSRALSGGSQHQRQGRTIIPASAAIAPRSPEVAVANHHRQVDDIGPGQGLAVASSSTNSSCSASPGAPPTPATTEHPAKTLQCQARERHEQPDTGSAGHRITRRRFRIDDVGWVVADEGEDVLERRIKIIS